MSVHNMGPADAASADDMALTGEEEGEDKELLGMWKEGATDFVEARSSKPWWRSNGVKHLTAIALVLGMLAVIGLTLCLTIWSNKGHGDGHKIQSSDYLLDASWNTQARSRRREYWWVIRDHIFNPDGIYRPMILVNHQFPGPLIEANEGDTVVVHVDNQAINATAIHWHGIYQNGTPHMDGTVGVSQCPIAPGGQFTYEFTVAGQSGTYWWHAHHGVQSSDGLHGPLVIHGRNEKSLQQIEYTTDRVVLVSDHYHDLSSALLWQYLKPGMENAEPVPNGGLINGKSIRDCDDFADRKCDNSSSHVRIPQLDLAPNESHRLRFINVGAFAEFQVQVDEHELAVTEVDGTDVVPMRYHRINISPAQRYSVILETNATKGDAFWLRARMITTCFTDPPKNLQSEVRATVRYPGTGVSGQIPQSRDWHERVDRDCKDMNVTDLVPVDIVAAPGKADALFYLRSNFEIGAYRLSRGFFNATSWKPNVQSPSLLRSINGLKDGNVTFQSSGTRSLGNAFVNVAAFDSSRELVVQTTGIQTIDILVSNFDDGNHPLHLHGYNYFVLAQGQGYPPLTPVGSEINMETLRPMYDNIDLSNPLRRDTASVEAFGWILLRLVADNVGAWAFHCHVSWHSEAGLLMQLLTRSDELARLTIPDASTDLCTGKGLEKGLGPADEAYHELAR